MKKYRSFLDDFRLNETRKRELSSRKERLTKDSSGRSTTAKLERLEKEEKALAKKETSLLAQEEKLLKKAKAPPRDPNAHRVGERRR